MRRSIFNGRGNRGNVKEGLDNGWMDLFFELNLTFWKSFKERSNFIFYKYVFLSFPWSLTRSFSALL
jgi:hypothetical protein